MSISKFIINHYIKKSLYTVETVLSLKTIEVDSTVRLQLTVHKNIYKCVWLNTLTLTIKYDSDNIYEAVLS